MEPGFSVSFGAGGPAWDLPWYPWASQKRDSTSKGSAASGNVALVPLRAQGRQEKNFSFNLASKFGVLGREGSDFSWKGRS